ncbi:beta-lactamase-like protein [Absidia repens]|uniref:Zinc phosphodiesterase ELAC protein 2 n=1 Tax=Absidia repens TaxID=90262 RepID=A0A1X2I9L7_9FUNG|nr:beta-lactamase-like protein [Absidia repens]
MLVTKRIAYSTSLYLNRLSPFISSSKQNIRTMSTSLRFVGHSSSEGPPSIIYQHNNDHYLFNCREGTQRLAVEDKVKLSKLKSIFFTRTEWECTGGMPGMLLTLADAGLQNVNLFGGKNLTHYMASTRFFVYRTSMTVHTREFVKDDQELDTFNDSNVYEDSSIKVTPVIITPQHPQASRTSNRRSQSPTVSSSSDYSPSDNPYSTPKHAIGSESTNIDDHKHRTEILSLMFSNQRKPNHASKDGDHAMNAPCTPRQHPLTPAANSPDAIVELQKASDEKRPQAIVTPVEQDQQNEQPNHMTKMYEKNLPRTRPSKTAISYICQTPETRGKFLSEEAKRLGVPVGPLFGQLQKGESVTLEDGTVVTQSQVVGKSIPGSIFVVVDCPEPAYIDSLINSPEFLPYQSEAAAPKVIIHLIGDKVLDDIKYRQWMNKFSPETEHIIGSEAVCAQTSLFRSHALSQYKLSNLDPRIFKVPEYCNIPQVILEKYGDLPPKVSPLMNKSSYQFKETRKSNSVGIQLDETPPFDVHRPFDDPKMLAFNENVEIHRAIDEAKHAANQVNEDKSLAGGNVEVVTLGTGSSIPSKYRNVSATLIKIPGFGSVLLDAGEGTYGQMLRHFGREHISKELDDLRCIFVSHLHADHHLGVFQLLLKRNKPKKAKNTLFLIAPYDYQRWMKEYNDVEHLGSPRRLQFIRCNHVLGRNLNAPVWAKDTLNLLKDILGLSKIEAVDVIHCRHAYGLSLEHKTGWKLVYSGDTRPCDRLIEAGQNATLLIHEATLEDSMKTEAIAKRHSTTAEAIEVGQKMNARYTLLNHFSQRYAKVPSLSEEQANVCISFDLMSVQVKQIPLLPKFNNAIQMIFKEEEEDDDNDIGDDSKRPHNKKKEDRKLKRRKMENEKEQ